MADTWGANDAKAPADDTSWGADDTPAARQELPKGVRASTAGAGRGSAQDPRRLDAAPEQPDLFADPMGTGAEAITAAATPRRESVLEGLDMPEPRVSPASEAENARLSRRDYAEATPAPGDTRARVRASTGAPERPNAAADLGGMLSDASLPVRAGAKALAGTVEGGYGAARAAVENAGRMSPTDEITGMQSHSPVATLVNGLLGAMGFAADKASGGKVTVEGAREQAGRWLGGAAKAAGDFQHGMGEGTPARDFSPRGPANYLANQFEGAASSLGSSAALAVGLGAHAVIPMLSVQSAGQQYQAARQAGLEPGLALANAVPFGAFEAIGEKFQGLDKAAAALRTLLTRGAPKDAIEDAGKILIKAGVREVPGEVITYVGQSGVDLLPGIGINQELTVDQFLDGLRDTVVQASMMGLTTASGGAIASARARRPADKTPEQLAREQGLAKREETAKRMKEAGEDAIAATIQREVDAERAQGELAVLADKPWAKDPAFAERYQQLRTQGTKPAEAAARAAMGSTFGTIGAGAGLPESAVNKAIEAAAKLPLEKVPGFLEAFTGALVKKGMSQPIPGGTIEGATAGVRDDAVATTMDALYGEDPPTATIEGIQDLERQQDAAAPAPQEGSAALAEGFGEADRTPIEHGAHAAATSPENDLPEPTEAQKKAGNYKVGRARIAGMDLSIENPQGSTRSGTDEDGKPWETTMAAHYGYIRRSEAADGDHVDTFVKPGTPEDFAGPVYVVDQVNPKTGRYDEAKVVLGAADQAEAEAIYRSNYSADWKGLGAITELSMEQFKKWAYSDAAKQPLSPAVATEAAAAAAPVPGAGQKAGADAAADRAGRQAGVDAAADGQPALSDKAAPLRLGITPNDAQPVTVRNGIVHVGEDPAYDYDSGEPVQLPDGATDAQIKKALQDAGAVSRRQKFFGGQKDAGLPPDAGAPAARWATMSESQRQGELLIKGKVPPAQVPDMALGDWNAIPAKYRKAIENYTPPAEPTEPPPAGPDGDVASRWDGWTPAQRTQALEAIGERGQNVRRNAGREWSRLDKKLREKLPGNAAPVADDADGQSGVDAVKRVQKIAEEAKTAAEEQLPEGLVEIPPDAAEFASDFSAIMQAAGEDERERATFRPDIQPVSLPRVDKSNPKPKGIEFLTPEQAAAKLQEWKAEAERQAGEKTMANAMRTVISLFDASGVLAQPWVDAGYNVVAYDLQNGDDINEFDAQTLLERHGNDEIWAILAQPPCTDFASSGAQWWKAKDADGRTEASNELVRQTLRTIELFRPPVWVMENPVGRIREQNNLPAPLLKFDPWHFGDNYTKRTELYGNFNPELPLAPVEPTQGSKMHNLSSSAKYERSLTPEGFAYALFMANNAEAFSVPERLAREFHGIDAELFRAALDAGHPELDVRSAIEDSYYDSDLEYVREELARLAKPEPPAPLPEDLAEKNGYTSKRMQDGVVMVTSKLKEAEARLKHAAISTLRSEGGLLVSKGAGDLALAVLGDTGNPFPEPSKRYSDKEAEREWDRMSPERRGGVLRRLASSLGKDTPMASERWGMLAPWEKKFAHRAMDFDHASMAGPAPAQAPAPVDPAVAAMAAGAERWNALTTAMRTELLYANGIGKDTDQAKFAKWESLAPQLREKLEAAMPASPQAALEQRVLQTMGQKYSGVSAFTADWLGKHLGDPAQPMGGTIGAERAQAALDALKEAGRIVKSGKGYKLAPKPAEAAAAAPAQSDAARWDAMDAAARRALIAKHTKAKDKTLERVSGQKHGELDATWHKIIERALAATPQRETITPSQDEAIGQNDAGEPLYRRQDGSVYRMHAGRPDFGGDLAPAAADNQPVASLFGEQKPDPRNTPPVPELDGFKAGDRVKVTGRTTGNSTVELLFTRNSSGMPMNLARVREDGTGKKLDVLTSELEKLEAAADAPVHDQTLSRDEAIARLEAGGRIVTHPGTEFETTHWIEQQPERRNVRATWVAKSKEKGGVATFTSGPGSMESWGPARAAAKAADSMTFKEDTLAENAPSPVSVRPAGKGATAIVIDPSAAAPAPTSEAKKSNNTVFTDEAAAAARARLKAKLGRLNSGIDPQDMLDGITLAGWHVEHGARKFADFARAMLGDLGEAVRPYLKSWYMGVRYDPRAAQFAEDMSSAAFVDEFDLAGVTAAEAQPQDAAPSDSAPAETADTQQETDHDSTPDTDPPADDRDLAAPEPRPVDDKPQRGATRAPRGAAGRADAGGVRPGDGAAAGAADAGRPVGDGRGDRAVPDGRAGDLGRDRQPSPADTAGDFRAQPGSLTREGSWLDTARRNVDLIELAIRIEAEGRPATPEEQAQLAKYVGFGAGEIRNKLFPVPSQWQKQQDPERLIWPDNVYSAGWKELAARMDKLPREWQKSVLQSTQYAHYTSEGIVRGTWAALERMGFTGGRVLEPGSGTGNFAMLMPEHLRRPMGYTGVEFDGPTALIARLLSPAQNMLHADFIKRKFPRDFYDVAIGNPPFSQTPILADAEYEKHKFMLHDFFFAKAIDRVRPGGLLAFVTSKGTMDKKTDKARAYLAARADFLGAIRLPSVAFEANAGTSVVADVVFLRKRAPGDAPAGETWTDVATIETKDGPAVVNEYFARHPEMVLGQPRLSGFTDDEGRRINANGYGQQAAYTVVSYDQTPAELDAKFLEAVGRLPANVYSVMRADAKTLRDEARRVDHDPSVKREGVVYKTADGTLMRVEQGVGKSLELSAKDAAWFSAYVDVRELVQQARQAQAQDGEWDKALKALNKAYDAFVKTHGPINAFRTQTRKGTDEDGKPTETTIRVFTNKRLLREDYDHALMLQLEEITEDGQIRKSKFLTERTIGKPVEREVRTAGDALAVSLDETGRLDLADVARRLHITEQEAADALGSAVYKAPTGQWQLADEYLSGDVVAKLEEAQEAARHDPSLARNIEALKAVQPDKLGPSQISVKLGAGWVKAEYVSEFAKEIEAGKVAYDPLTETWQVDGATLRSSRRAGAEYGTADRSPSELLEAALNSRKVEVRYPQSAGKDLAGKINQDATTAANQAIEKIKDKFRSWIWQDSERATDLVESYNRRFNNIAPRRFDGSHLTLPGVSLRFKLHPHQLRAIWRQIQTGDTYLAHAVGAGKTIEMIAGGMEQKRLGLIKKPVYVVPNHMLEQFSNEFMELYPLANIMVADDENFSAERRRAFVAAAALNAPDAVVITQSAFERIGLTEDSVAPIRDEILDELEAELDDAKGDRVRRSQLEQQIEAVTQRFDSIIGMGKKDNVIPFEDLGIDFIYADEAHAYRKLDFTTNQQVKGIDPSGSRRALDMYVKTRVLQRRRPGRSMVFASGTPVTNTMGELYTLQRFFQPEEMARIGASSFDGWARQFGEVKTELEMNAAGRYELVTRFSKFENVPELMNRVRQFMDVLTSDHLGAIVKRPDIKGGKPNLNLVPPSKALQAYMRDELGPRLEISRAWKPSPDQPFNPDPVLAIISDGRFAALDPRFFGGTLEPGETSKLDEMARKVAATYHATKDNEYTDRDGKPEKIKGATQIVFYNLGFGEGSMKNRGFNARDHFTRALTKAGVKRDHILWFDDANTDAKKEAMFTAMRNGTARILIGSAKKMGTGVNVQKRLAELHYFDPPWYPSDVEQPHGRLIRQGNQNAEGSIEWYATKGGYDATMWQMVGRKQRFIDQAFTGDKNLRTIEDIGEASQYEQAAALASGDPRAIQLAGLRQDVERLERQQSAHHNEQINARSALRSANWSAEASEKRIAALTAAIEHLGGGYFSFGQAFVGERQYDKPGEWGDALKGLFNRTSTQQGNGKPSERPVVLGKMGPVELRAYPDWREVVKAKDDEEGPARRKEYRGLDLTAVIGDEAVSIFDGSYLELGDNVDAAGLARRVVNAANGLSGERDRRQAQLREAQEDIRRLQKKLGAPFEHAQTLAEKYGQLKQLEDELRAEGEALAKEQQAAAAAQPASPTVDARGAAAGETASWPQVARILEGYNTGADGISTVGDVANELQAALDNGEAPEQLREALEAYRQEQQDDYQLAGRGDMDAADERLLAAMQQHAGGDFEAGQQRGDGEVHALVRARLERRLAGGASIEQARAVLDKVSAKWQGGPTIHVIRSPLDVPGIPLNTLAYWKGHEVWVVAGMHRAGKDLERALLRSLAHEAIAHYGLRALLGKRGWEQLMGNIQLAIASGNRPLRAIRDYVAEAYKDAQLSPARQADEIAARAVEQAIDARGNFAPGFGFLKAVWSRVAQFLRSIGIDVAFTHAELQGMLVRAAKGLETGKRHTGRDAMPLPDFERGQRAADGAGHRTVQVDGERYPDSNSKGQALHPTFQGQVNFWRWFRGSKVVDADGRPLVMYHGTEAEDAIDAFETGSRSASTRDPSRLLGAFFTPSTAWANEYANFSGTYGGDEHGAVYPVYLSIKNPATVTSEELASLTEDKARALRKRLEAAGHDGLVVDDGEREVIAFRPEQIKSATGNSGQFDAQSPNILESRADGEQPPELQTHEVSMAPALATAMRRWQRGRIGERELAAAIAADLQQRQQRREEAATRDRVRGPDWIRERLLRARRQGELPVGQGQVDLALWLLEQAPQLAEGLGLSIRTRGGSPELGAQGTYNSAARVVTLFTDAGQPETAVHEILHHTERMMPREVQDGIRREWLAQLEAGVARAKAKLQAPAKKAPAGPLGWGSVGSSTETDDVQAQIRSLDAMVIAAREGDADLAMALWRGGRVLPSLSRHLPYQLSTPSEFWAVNAARIVHERGAAAGGSWVDRAVQWLGELLERAKGLLRLRSDAPVLRGLRAVMAGDGRFQPGAAMLGDRRGAVHADFADAGAQRRDDGEAGEPLPLGAWEMPADSKTDRLIYELQDGRIDLKRVQQAIEGAGGTIEERFDARLGETLYPGRVARRTETFIRREVRPLLEALARARVTMTEFEDFLIARHAPERNAQVAKVNPDLPDGGAGRNSHGTLMTDEAALAYIQAIPRERLAQLAELADYVDRITAGTRALLVAEGLEKQSTIDAWQGAYQHYVPLFKEEGESGTPHPTGSGFNVRGSASKRSTGSTAQVRHVLAHLLTQREAAITRAEKNRVALQLYGLALAHPNRDFWTTVKPSMPEAIITRELQRLGVDVATARSGMSLVPTIREVSDITGEVVDRPNPLYKNLPTAITLRLNGEDRVLMLNAQDPRAQRMAADLKNLDGLTRIDLAGTVIGRSTRWLAAVNTQYNPAFGLANLTRDTWGGLVNLGSTPLRGKALKVLARVPLAMQGILRALATNEHSQDRWARLWLQFQADGGRTGWRDMWKAPDDRAAALEAELQQLQASKAGPKAIARAAARGVLQILDGYNTILENAVRLAAYQEAIEAREAGGGGMSRAEAARLARELTVDFNRKGRSTRELSPLYAFFNASVQGMSRTLETLRGPTGAAVIAGGLTLGVLQALLLLAADYDDDEIPEFVKTRSLILPLPRGADGKKRFLQIPYPLGLHVLPNTGRVATELGLNGGRDLGRRVFQALGEVAGAFNPLGSGDITTAHGALTTVAPTLADPLVDIAANRNFAGNPIERETRGETDPRPGFQRARESTLRRLTGQAYAEVARIINQASGGTPYEAGVASPTPERIRYVAQTIGGGVLREFEKAVDAGHRLASGEPGKAGDLPILGRFVGEVDDARVQESRYYEASRKVDRLQAATGAAKKAGDAAALEQLAERPEAALARAQDQVQRHLQALNRLAVQTVGDREAMRQLDEARTEQMRALNEAIRELERARGLTPGERVKAALQPAPAVAAQ